MFAVWQGHEALVVALLEASRRCGHEATDGAVGRLPKSGRSLLMVASRFGHLRIATRLCKASPRSRSARSRRAGTSGTWRWRLSFFFFPAQGAGDAGLPRPDRAVPRRARRQRGPHPHACQPGRQRQRLVSETQGTQGTQPAPFMPSQNFIYFPNSRMSFYPYSDNQGQTVLKLAERCRPQATCNMLKKAGAQLEAVPAGEAS